ncbi:hypothetical protein WT06_10320 [Burkholderia anthina]|uniref:hypothetical protein n=1 Tax=Burkholderia cepacia complex TaxID=87882 RepID=UPI00076DACC6|nr:MULTISPECIES: hypothetical protein [Burkholderia cepacia complex]KVM94700.1 hypothetical protein WT06_10320 [Burkholderia anthina]MBY4698223.1 hypothetical protein [Burkholderia latens]
MASADDIRNACESVSLVLQAIDDLALLIMDVPPTGLVKPYHAMFAFSLLAQMASEKLAVVDGALSRAVDVVERVG